MSRVVFSLSAAPGMAEGLARCFEADLGELETRQFPDGETYLRIATPVSGRDVVLLCTLDRPDAKIAPLLFAADALRDRLKKGYRGEKDGIGKGADDDSTA